MNILRIKSNAIKCLSHNKHSINIGGGMVTMICKKCLQIPVLKKVKLLTNNVISIIVTNNIFLFPLAKMFKICP